VARSFGHLDPADVACIAGGACVELFQFDDWVMTALP
jgi:hypothetical protein